VAAFWVFMVVNATLFIRPAEIIPALLGWPIYQVLILLCLALALPAVLEELTSRNLGQRPITICVLGVLLMVWLSHLCRFNLEGAWETGTEFAKVAIYFLLLVVVVNTGQRLKTFLYGFGIFTMVLAAVAVLQYHGVISVLNISVLQDTQLDTVTGLEIQFPRLRGSGAFADPNDLSLVLVVGLLICLHGLSEPGAGAARVLWLGGMLLFGYALALTQSRGGFLALLTGLMVLFTFRFGWQKSLALGAVVLPVLLLVFGGRQTSLSASATTGQTRIQLWSDGLMLFKDSLALGIGMSEYAKEAGQVAHNAYLHLFTELGFVGGACFLGAVGIALWSLYRVGSGRRLIIQPDLRRLHPYLMAVVAAYATGMLSLSVGDIVLTYTILGLAAVFVQMVVTYPAWPRLVMNGRLVQYLAGTGVVFLASVYVFVRLFLRWA
jgi:hypothetical protein